RDQPSGGRLLPVDQAAERHGQATPRGAGNRRAHPVHARSGFLRQRRRRRPHSPGLQLRAAGQMLRGRASAREGYAERLSGGASSPVGCLKKVPVKTTEFGKTTMRPVGFGGSPASSRSRIRKNPISMTSPYTYANGPCRLTRSPPRIPLGEGSAKYPTTARTPIGTSQSML